jgi:hypothetical protein
MVLGFISGTLAAIFLIVGLVTLFSKRARRLLNIVRRLPVIGALSPFLISMILIGLGLMAGGFSVVQGWIPLGIGDVLPASVTPATSLPPTTISYCEYTEGHAVNDNITIRADTSRTDLVWLDTPDIWINSSNTSILGAACNDEASGQYEAQINITCVRSGTDVYEDGAVEIVAKGDKFLSELDPSSASEYGLLELKSTTSSVWSGEYQQEIYLAESTQPTTSSDIERTYLTYSEGEKELTLGIAVELDKQACQQLNNYTTSHIKIYQRDGGDDEIFTIAVKKVPSITN